MQITHERGQWVGLTDKNGIERLRYDYASAPKPFLHPLRLPDGTVITEHEPADHVWHRGLWFAFKFVNGINYWEERDEVIGYQHTTSTDLYEDAELAAFHHNLDWKPNNTDTAVIQERRSLAMQFHKDMLSLSLYFHITALNEVVLDRTPFTTWGGYGGLFVRLRNDLKDARLVFDDGTTTTKCTGERYQWGGIEGTTPEGSDCAVVFLPAKNNTLWPEPFYGHARPDYHFFGPAPLFHGPITLAQGERLSYGVRVLVLPRRIDPSEVSQHR